MKRVQRERVEQEEEEAMGMDGRTGDYASYFSFW